MSHNIKKVLCLFGGLLIAATVMLLVGGIKSLADIAGYFDPAFGPIVFFSLSALLGLFFLYALMTLVVLPKPLLFPANGSEEALREYRQKLLERLQKNTYLKEQGVACATEDDMPEALAALEAKANEYISETSRQVFIGTATSQNGRLDSLISTVLITRLVYRIAKLHNNRLHYRELYNLYVNVAGTAFIAVAIEDLVVEEYTQQIVSPLVASSAVGLIPGAQAIASVVTTSVLNGATNSLLAMRCGIIARNYLGQSGLELATDSGTARRSASKEAAAMFMRTSGATVSKVTQLLVAGASEKVKSGMQKAWDAVSNVAESTGDSIYSGVKAGATAGVDGISAAGGVIWSGAKVVGKGVHYGVTATTRGVVYGAEAAASGVYSGVKTGASASVDGLNAAGDAVWSGAKVVGKGVQTGVSVTTRGVVYGAEAAASGVCSGVKAGASAGADGLSAAGDAVVSGAKAVGRGVSATTRGVTHGVTKTASFAAGGVKSGASAVGNAVGSGVEAASSLLRHRSGKKRKDK